MSHASSALRRVEIAPSILATDFVRLGQQVTEVEQGGADRLHVDVMDGHFVPNLSLGPAVVRSLRKFTQLPLATHLMVSEPDRYLEAFTEAGADALIVHIEGAIHLHRTVHRIKELGRKAGVALNPATPAALLEEILPDLDSVLVMTVNPGFGGQAFIPGTLPKLQRIRELLDQINPDCDLAVDGGIEVDTAPLVVRAGANVLVAGTAIFHNPLGPAAAVRQLREAARDAERVAAVQRT